MFSFIFWLTLTSAVCLVASQTTDGDPDSAERMAGRGAGGDTGEGHTGPDTGEGVDSGEGADDVTYQMLSKLPKADITRMLAGMEAGLKYNYQGQIAEPGQPTFTLGQLRSFVTRAGSAAGAVAAPPSALPTVPVPGPTPAAKFTIQQIRAMIDGMRRGSLYNFQGQIASPGEHTLTMQQLQRFMNQLLAQGLQTTADFTKADLDRMIQGMQNGLVYNYQGQLAQPGEPTLTLDQINELLAQLETKGMGVPMGGATGQLGGAAGGDMQTVFFTTDDIKRMKDGMQRGLKYNFQGQEASAGEREITLKELDQLEAQLLAQGHQQTADFTRADLDRMILGMQSGNLYNYQGQIAQPGEPTLTLDQINDMLSQLEAKGMGGSMTGMIGPMGGATGGAMQTAFFTMDDIDRMRTGMKRGLKYNFQGQEASAGEKTLSLKQLDDFEAQLRSKGMGGPITGTTGPMGGTIGGAMQTADFTFDDIKRMKAGMPLGIKYNYMGKEAAPGEMTLTLPQLEDIERRLLLKGMGIPTKEGTTRPAGGAVGGAMRTASFTIDDINRMKAGMQRGLKYNYQGQEASPGEMALSLQQLDNLEAQLRAKGMGGTMTVTRVTRPTGTVMGGEGGVTGGAMQTASFSMDDINRMKAGMQRGIRYNYQGQEAGPGEMTLTLEQLNAIEAQLRAIGMGGFTRTTSPVGGVTGGVMQTASFTTDDINRMKAGMQRGLKYNFQGQEASPGEMTLSLEQLDDLEARLMAKGMGGVLTRSTSPVGGVTGGFMKTASFTMDDINRMKGGMQRGVKYNFQGVEAAPGEMILTLEQLNELEARLMAKGMGGVLTRTTSPVGGVTSGSMQTASFTMDDINRMKAGMQRGVKYNFQGVEAAPGEVTLTLEQLNDLESQLLATGIGGTETRTTAVMRDVTGGLIQTVPFTIDDINRMKAGMQRGLRYNIKGQEAAPGEITLTLGQLNALEEQLLAKGMGGQGGGEWRTVAFTLEDINRMKAGMQQGKKYNYQGQEAAPGEMTLTLEQLNEMVGNSFGVGGVSDGVDHSAPFTLEEINRMLDGMARGIWYNYQGQQALPGEPTLTLDQLNQLLTVLTRRGPGGTISTADLAGGKRLADLTPDDIQRILLGMQRGETFNYEGRPASVGEPTLNEDQLRSLLEKLQSSSGVSGPAGQGGTKAGPRPTIGGDVVLGPGGDGTNIVDLNPSISDSSGTRPGDASALTVDNRPVTDFGDAGSPIGSMAMVTKPGTSATSAGTGAAAVVTGRDTTRTRTTGPGSETRLEAVEPVVIDSRPGFPTRVTGSLSTGTGSGPVTGTTSTQTRTTLAGAVVTERPIDGTTGQTRTTVGAPERVVPQVGRATTTSGTASPQTDTTIGAAGRAVAPVVAATPQTDTMTVPAGTATQPIDMIAMPQTDTTTQTATTATRGQVVPPRPPGTVPGSVVVSETKAQAPVVNEIKTPASETPAAGIPEDPTKTTLKTGDLAKEIVGRPDVFPDRTGTSRPATPTARPGESNVISSDSQTEDFASLNFTPDQVNDMLARMKLGEKFNYEGKVAKEGEPTIPREKIQQLFDKQSAQPSLPQFAGFTREDINRMIAGMNEGKNYNQQGREAGFGERVLTLDQLNGLLREHDNEDKKFIDTTRFTAEDVARLLDGIEKGVRYNYKGENATVGDRILSRALLMRYLYRFSPAEINRALAVIVRNAGFTIDGVNKMIRDTDNGIFYNYFGQPAKAFEERLTPEMLQLILKYLIDQAKPSLPQLARFTREDINRMIAGMNEGKNYNQQGREAGFGERVLTLDELNGLLREHDNEDKKFFDTTRFTVEDVARLLDGIEKGVRYNYKGENATAGDRILTRALLMRYLYRFSPAEINRALGVIVRNAGFTIDDVNKMIRDTDNGIFYNYFGQPAKAFEERLTPEMLQLILKYLIDQDNEFLTSARFTVNDIVRLLTGIQEGKRFNYKGEISHIGERALDTALLLRYLYRLNIPDIDKALYIIIRISNFTIPQIRKMISDTEKGIRYNYFGQIARPDEDALKLEILRLILAYLTDAALPNVALHKKAEISSTYSPIWPADKAIDGNTDQDMDQNSCFHTGPDREPYFMLDLGGVYDIKRLKIYNRLDCCDDRLKNVQISTGLTLDSLVEKNFIPGPFLPETTVTFTAPTLAQFIKIQVKETIPTFMHLCEVEVFGTFIRDDACKGNPCKNGGKCTNTGGPDNCRCPEGWGGLDCTGKDLCVMNPCLNGGTCVNIPGAELCRCAPGWIGSHCQISTRNIGFQKRVYMSSLYLNDNKYGAEKGVDGDKSTDLASGACFSTDLERNPFWAIDLGAVYELQEIRLTNRMDCCTERTKNIEILAGITKDKMQSVYFHAGPLGPNQTIPIMSGTQGQYLTIMMKTQKPEYLHLCEVEIYGTYLRPDQCTELSCLNGGTCTNKGNLDNCICPSGFGGARCQIDESKYTETQLNVTEIEPSWAKSRVDPAACRRSNCNLPICYIPYANDCKSYVVCQRTAIGTYVAWRMRCAFGSYWGTGKTYTCERVEDLARQGYTCPNDPCADRSRLTYPDEEEDNCRTYWRCENGVSQPTCCPPGERFDRAILKCVKDPLELCRMPCPLRVAGCAPGSRTQPFYDGNCRTYWDCEKGHPHPACCPDGMSYDFLKGHCQLDPTCTVECPQEFRQRVCGKVTGGQAVASYTLPDGNCRTYMKCTADGYDDPFCCRQNFFYDTTTGKCEKVEDVNSSCHKEVCPAGYKEECRFSPTDNPTKFYDNDANIVHDCAPGTTFAPSICTCDGTAYQEVCKAEVWVKFNNLDDQTTIKNYGDGAISIFGPLTKNVTDQGLTYGTFDGASGLEVWRYDHTAFPEVTLEVTFQPVSTGRERRIITSNCMSVDNGHPSFEVSLDPVTSQVIFTGKSKFDAVEVAVPFNKNGWNTYKLFFDGENVVALVEDPAGIGAVELQTAKLRGEIVAGVGALKFGPCQETVGRPKDNGFIGFISEAIFSKCVDGRAKDFIQTHVKPSTKRTTTMMN